MKEEIYRLILEASRSKEAMERLEGKLALLPEKEAMAYRLLAKGLGSIVKRGESLRKVKEVLMSVMDRRVLDEFDKAILDFFTWLPDEGIGEG